MSSSRNVKQSCHLECGFFMTMHYSTSWWLHSKLSMTGFVQLKYPTYSAVDLAPSDYFTIRNLKSRLPETRFTDAESLNISVKAWFDRQDKEFVF